jgi:hypothetical protein
MIDWGRSLFYTPQALTSPATEVDAMLTSGNIFRDEIHNFIRVTNVLIALRQSPDYHRLSNEERAAIAYYLEALQHFLRQELIDPDPAQRLIPF